MVSGGTENRAGERESVCDNDRATVRDEHWCWVDRWGWADDVMDAPVMKNMCWCWRRGVVDLEPHHQFDN